VYPQVRGSDFDPLSRLALQVAQLLDLHPFGLDTVPPVGRLWPVLRAREAHREAHKRPASDDTERHERGPLSVKPERNGTPMTRNITNHSD
jgi:hypothetical protein